MEAILLLKSGCRQFVSVGVVALTGKRIWQQHILNAARQQIYHWDRMNDVDQPEISEFKSKSGLKRIFSAFMYSIEGFKSAWRMEHAFRQELVLVVFGTIIALCLPASAVEKLMLIGVLILVLIVELINSAVEAVVDRVSLERNPLSKNAKDFGSAAVFLSLCLAAATWAVVLIPRFVK